MVGDPWDAEIPDAGWIGREVRCGVRVRVKGGGRGRGGVNTRQSMMPGHWLGFRIMPLNT